MGRYYDGDINGKFWFGVQSSNAADRFGQTGCEPSYIEYYYTEDDEQSVKDELKAIVLKLGGQFEKMEEYFSQNNGYNNKMLDEAGIDIALLSDYADYCLGKQILECIKEFGVCSFTAEL